VKPYHHSPPIYLNGLHGGNLTFMFLVHVHNRQCRPMVQVKRFHLVVNRRQTYRAVLRSMSRVYVKVRLFLSMPRRCMGGAEVCFHSFLTSALNGGIWFNSRPGRFYLPERNPVTIE